MLYEVVILQQTNKQTKSLYCQMAATSAEAATLQLQANHDTINQSDLQQQTKIKDSRIFLNPTQNERKKERKKERMNE